MSLANLLSQASNKKHPNMRRTTRTYYVLIGSFIIATLLTIMPIPVWAEPFRPEWILLLVIYWSMTTPRWIGVGSAWGLGLMVDVLRGALLAQHALGFALTAFISIRFYQRVRVYPLHQQALFIAMILLPHMSVSLWVYGVLGQDPESWTYWSPALTSALVWPWIYIVMRAVRRTSDLD